MPGRGGGFINASKVRRDELLGRRAGIQVEASTEGDRDSTAWLFSQGARRLAFKKADSHRRPGPMSDALQSVARHERAVSSSGQRPALTLTLDAGCEAIPAAPGAGGQPEAARSTVRAGGGRWEARINRAALLIALAHRPRCAANGRRRCAGAAPPWA